MQVLIQNVLVYVLAAILNIPVSGIVGYFKKTQLFVILISVTKMRRKYLNCKYSSNKMLFHS